MSSDSNPASNADAGGDGSLDLGTLFAPLSRETIEMFLVRMISKHPEDVYWMIQAAKKPVDTLEIHNHVSTTVLTGTSIGWVVDELQPHITRAVDYLKSGHVRNSTAILETLTPQIAEWAAENGSLEEMEMEDKTSMEELFANMEEAWQQVIDACQIVESPPSTRPSGVAASIVLTRTSGAEKQAKQRATAKLTYQQLGSHEVEHMANMLSEAKKKLTSSNVGPMFSDPLRSLNKKRTATATASTASSSAASSTTSSSSTASTPSTADPSTSASHATDSSELSTPAAVSSSTGKSDSSTSATVGTKRKADDAKPTAAAVSTPKPMTCSVVIAPPAKKKKQK